MARDFFIAGECMVNVKGRSDSPLIASSTQLGLSADPIRLRLTFRHEDIQVDAWGGNIPAEVQFMLAEVSIHMTLIHFDNAILEECKRLSMGGASSFGQLGRAGQRMGNNLPRFAPSPNPGSPSTGNNSGNNYIGLNISSPVSNLPWRFLFTYLAQNPEEFPLGTEKSAVALNWRCIPYTQDPFGGGTGAYNYPLFDHNVDT